jgi:hypothetical protein
MSNTHAFVEDGTVEPGRHLHLTFEMLTRPHRIDVSVVDRVDLEATAALDGEGWAVIIVTNVTDIPVSISPLEPLHLVIIPRREAVNLKAVDRPATRQK